MNLSQMYYFRALGKMGSYKQAAKELYISQPALSMAIKKLEEELGRTLIDRKTKKATLTPDGEKFFVCCCQATEIIDSYLESIKDDSNYSEEEIKLGIVFSAQDRVWSNLLREFMDSVDGHPQITTTQGISRHLIEQLRECELDTIISGIVGDTSGLITVPLWSQPLTLAVHTKNPLSRRKSVSLQDLRPYNIITYTKDGPMKNEITAFLSDANLPVHYRYLDEITMCSMVNADENTVALVAHSWLVDSFEDVVTVPVEGSPHDFHRFFLIYRNNPLKHTALHEFIEFMSHHEY